MDTIQKLWAVWYITQDNKLSHIEYTGPLEHCVNIVQALSYGSWGILPYDNPN